MQAEFDSLRSFDFQQANLHLWVFKKSTSVKKYTAHYVRTNQQLEGLLKNLIYNEINRITEFSAYSYLAENNENSCLTASVDQTDFNYLKIQVDRPEPECEVNKIKELKGSQGYLVKFSINNETIYAVKRPTSTWKTSYPKKFINIIFRNGELAAAEEDTFSIEKSFDFYCKGSLLFIANKRAFEAVLKHQVAYYEKFEILKNDQTFCSLFTDIKPVIDYVGNNSIHLRRMAVVEEKGIYSNPNFLNTLKRVNDLRSWGINFDPANNKIIACDKTAKIILQILLDHRLISEITSQTYDVPDATQI